MSIVIKNTIVNSKTSDILIEGNRIAAIGDNLTGDHVLDGRGFIAVPAFYNMHSHAAMSLLRGYADDLELMDWLQNHIWPAEAKLDDESIYWGTKLAGLEMLKSGIVFFNDMYFSPTQCVQAADELGMRAAIGMTVLEGSAMEDTVKRNNAAIWEQRNDLPSRIFLTAAPHAIYTVSEKALRQQAEFAAQNNIMISIHLAETEYEVASCKEEHNGMTPVEYLNSIGFLSSRVVAAHCVHVTDNDCRILAETGTVVAFNPCSNLKLMSGLMPFRKMLNAGVRVTIGTDGNASNNNLSMFDEMKFAAMVAKLAEGSVTACTADEIYQSATSKAAKAVGLDGGELASGKLADILLLDANHPSLVPCHNLVSNLVYSADESCVDTVICDGRIVMQNHTVPGEEEILCKAREFAAKL